MIFTFQSAPDITTFVQLLIGNSLDKARFSVAAQELRFVEYKMVGEHGRDAPAPPV